jgi:hypothetical protein
VEVVVGVCAARCGAAIKTSFDLGGSGFAIGSTQISSSENSYEGSSPLRAIGCDIGVFFGGALFLGSGKELVRPFSGTWWSIDLPGGGSCDPEAVRIADELGCLGSCNSPPASVSSLDTGSGSSPCPECSSTSCLGESRVEARGVGRTLRPTLFLDSGGSSTRGSCDAVTLAFEDTRPSNCCVRTWLSQLNIFMPPSACSPDIKLF